MPEPQRFRLADLTREEFAEAMKDGALGLSSSLQYVPDRFNSTDDLVEMAKVAASYGGIYLTHLRSESGQIDAALDETFAVAERDVPRRLGAQRNLRTSTIFKTKNAADKLSATNRTPRKRQVAGSRDRPSFARIDAIDSRFDRDVSPDGCLACQFPVSTRTIESI